MFYHFLPFAAFLIYIILSFFQKLPTPPIDTIVSIQVIVYNIAGLLMLYRYHQKVKANFSRDEASTRNWVAIVLIGYIFACLIPPIFYFLGFYKDQTMIVKELISFFPFLIFYNILFFNAIGNPIVVHDIPKEDKYLGSLLTEELAYKYMAKLDQVISEEKLYLEPELTLNDISEKTGISSRYLSQIINQYKQKSFYDFINGLRADYACNLLLNENKKTILEILYESGFNSKTSFNTAFKKHTGLTPTQFKKTKNGSDS